MLLEKQYRPNVTCCIFAVIIIVLTGCGKGGHSLNNPPNDDRIDRPIKSMDMFNERISPILSSRCGVSCHGVGEDSYEKFMSDPINAKAFYFPLDMQTGKIPSKDLKRVYKVLTGEGRVDYSEESRFSHFLRVPLAEDFGGLPHRGLDVFYSTDDEDYNTLLNWLDLIINENKHIKLPLEKHVAYFRDNVLGVMERNGCFLSSCHGNQVFNDLKLTPPLPADNIGLEKSATRFSREMVLENRKTVLGKVSRLVNLGGDLTKSRLITKNLPIEKGGIHQRGGNIQFFESLQDQDVKIILNWLKMERQALVKELVSEDQKVIEDDLGAIKGIVFIRGPRHTPRKYFTFDTFYPGSDIYLIRLRDGETLENTTAKPINLTASLHKKSVEIQSLDVRYDAKKILFSMRGESRRGFRLYEISLNKNLDNIEGEISQLSFANNTLADGTLIHHVDPVYTPGPEDKEGHHLDEVAVAFASNEAGQYAFSDSYGILGEVDSGFGKVIVDRQRPEQQGYYTGKRIYFVAGPNKGEWRKILNHQPADGPGSGAKFFLDRALKGPLDKKTVYVIEKDKGLVQSSFDIWRFVINSPEKNEKERYKKSLRRMTFTYAQERRPSLRTTGEVMFTSVRNLGYQGDKPVFNGAIYRVQAGGFDYHIQGGNRSGYPIHSDSREMGYGLEVRQLHDPRNYWGGGLLALVDHGFGINIESGNPVDDIPYSNSSDDSHIQYSSPPRYIPAQFLFFDEQGKQAVTHTGVSLGGSVREPFPLLNGSVLTSYTPHALNHLDPEADPDWDIYTFSFEGSPQSLKGDKVGPFKKARINAASSPLAEYSARPLMVRLKEKADRPIHHQKFGSFTKTAEPKEVFGVMRMPAGLPGEIQCYDYPLLQSFLTNFTPVGAKDFRIKQGNPNGQTTAADQVFKYVRIIMQSPTDKNELALLNANAGLGDPFATRVSIGIHNKRVIVAEVPIEEDGSFYVEVPTEVPLIIQGLNKDKMAMHTMNRWFYLQPGEKLTFSIPRSIFPLRCTGCHGSLTGEPTQGVGPVDLVSASSRVMATWNQLEKKSRKAYSHGRTMKDYIAVDFRRDIQPILNERCVACHNGSSGENSFDLRGIPTKYYNKAYESLHKLTDPASGNYADKKYINEREALSSESELIKIIRSGKGRHATPSVKLNESEMLALIRWIDLGATFKGGKTND